MHKVLFTNIVLLFLSFECYSQNINPLGGYIKSNCLNCEDFNGFPEYEVYAFTYFTQGEFIPDSISISFNGGVYYWPMEKNTMENICDGLVKVKYGPYFYTFYQDGSPYVFCKFSDNTKFQGKNYAKSEKFLLSHILGSRQGYVDGTNESVSFKDCQLILCTKGKKRTFNIFGNSGSGKNVEFSFYSSNFPGFYGNVPSGCHINNSTGDITIGGDLDTGTYNITIGAVSEMWGKGGLPIAQSNFVLTFKVLEPTSDTVYFLENLGLKDSVGIPFFNIEKNQQTFSTSLGFVTGNSTDSFVYSVESTLPFSLTPKLTNTKTSDSTILNLEIENIQTFLPNLPASISIVATSMHDLQCNKTYRTSFYLVYANVNAVTSSSAPLPIKLYPNPVAEDLFCYSEKSFSVHIFDIYGQIVAEHKLEFGTNKLDVGSLAAGIYVLEFFSKDEYYSTKFVKQ